jgi:acetyl esterase/lipase
MKLNKLTIIMTCSLIALASYTVLAESDTQTARLRSSPLVSLPEPQTASQDWGELVVSEGVTTTYAIYAQNFVYGATPFLITDLRTDPDYPGKYSDKESYEARSLNVYRARDGQTWLDNQPVVFFVHGGAWIDEYANWYDFVAQSFTGEKGWVTVVIDYRLTSEEVFIADEHCPDRATCNLPENVPLRTKAAWYPDNIEDVADAFQWVVDNIVSNGGNADQIVVFGHSAGGHLVSLLATHPNSVALRPAIKGVISMSGAYSIKELSMVIFGSAIDQTWHGGHINNDAELDEASPTTYVVPGITLPSFYLLHAQTELPSLYEESIAFKNKLISLGLAVDSAYLLGYDHVTEMKAIEDINATPTALIVNYIEALLAHRVHLPLIIK